jgi:hypothetical protein
LHRFLFPHLRHLRNLRIKLPVRRHPHSCDFSATSQISVIAQPRACAHAPRRPCGIRNGDCRVPKRQRAGALQDASRTSGRSEHPPGFGLRQPSAAFPPNRPFQNENRKRAGRIANCELRISEWGMRSARQVRFPSSPSLVACAPRPARLCSSQRDNRKLARHEVSGSPSKSKTVLKGRRNHSSISIVPPGRIIYGHFTGDVVPG